MVGWLVLMPSCSQACRRVSQPKVFSAKSMVDPWKMVLVIGSNRRCARFSGPR